MRLKSVTEAYDAVIVEAENKNILDSTFRDVIFSAYFYKMGLLIDTTREKFKSLFEAYLSHKTVKEYLKDYIKSPLLQDRDVNLTKDSNSNSSAEYAKNKVLTSKIGR